VSQIDQLADGVYLTSEASSYADRNASDVHRALEAAAWYSRTWGDCYGYFLLATGRAVAMIDPEVCIWDAAALQPVVTEAGGTITDWAGNSTYTAGELIGTNGRVLEEVLALTRPHVRSGE
jgi:fructose-1,6-bisphosphatase/inositol monophosphatase family enzyme